jgi:hypothetical protein
MFNDQGCMSECIETSYSLLEDPASHRFHRMKMLILLGLTLGGGMKQTSVEQMQRGFGALSGAGILKARARS